MRTPMTLSMSAFFSCLAAARKFTGAGWVRTTFWFIRISPQVAEIAYSRSLCVASGISLDATGLSTMLCQWLI